MNSRSAFRHFARLRNACAIVMLLPVCLTGCAGVLQTRWVKPTDTADLWQARMPTLAIEVHDQAPGLDIASAVSRIPYAALSDGATPGIPWDDTTSLQRAVLYIGGNEIPTIDSYCQATPSLHPVGQPGHGVMMAAALCDGTRLVDTYRRVYTDEEIQQKGLSKLIEAMKSRLYWGLAIQPATPDPSYNG